jgi:hypothetical protein
MEYKSTKGDNIMWAKRKKVDRALEDLSKFADYIMEVVNDQTNALTEIGEFNIIMHNLIKVQGQRIQQLEEANGWSSKEASKRAEESIFLTPDNNNIH